MKNVQLQIGTRGNKSLSQLLIKKKPRKSMLIDATLRERTAIITATITTNVTSN